jgi:hypothetical protein
MLQIHNPYLVNHAYSNPNEKIGGVVSSIYPAEYLPNENYKKTIYASLFSFRGAHVADPNDKNIQFLCLYERANKNDSPTWQFEKNILGVEAPFDQFVFLYDTDDAVTESSGKMKFKQVKQDLEQFFSVHTGRQNQWLSAVPWHKDNTQSIYGMCPTINKFFNNKYELDSFVPAELRPERYHKFGTYGDFETYFRTHTDQNIFPCYIKPGYGGGGKGVIKCDTIEQLQKRCFGNPYLIDNQIVVDAAVDADINIGVQVQISPNKNLPINISGIGEQIINPVNGADEYIGGIFYGNRQKDEFYEQVFKTAHTAATQMRDQGAFGYFSFDVLRDKATKKPKIIECNFRLTGQVVGSSIFALERSKGNITDNLSFTFGMTGDSLSQNRKNIEAMQKHGNLITKGIVEHKNKTLIQGVLITPASQKKSAPELRSQIKQFLKLCADIHQPCPLSLAIGLCQDQYFSDEGIQDTYDFLREKNLIQNDTTLQQYFVYLKNHNG